MSAPPGGAAGLVLPAVPAEAEFPCATAGTRRSLRPVATPVVKKTTAAGTGGASITARLRGRVETDAPQLAPTRGAHSLCCRDRRRRRLCRQGAQEKLANLFGARKKRDVYP